MDYRKFIVTEEYEGERIDKYLTKIIQDSDEEITRSEINRQQMVEKINNTKCWISSIIKFIKLIGIAIK